MFLRILLLLSMSGMSYCHQNSGWIVLVEKGIQAGNFDTLYRALDLFPQDLKSISTLVAQLREKGEVQAGGERQHLLYDLAEKLQKAGKKR